MYRICAVLCTVMFLIPVILPGKGFLAAAYDAGTLEYDIAQAFESRSDYVDTAKYNVTFTAAFAAFERVIMENPKYFYVERSIYGNSRGFQISYLYTTEETALMQTQIDAEARNILDLITEDMTNAQKVCVVHDYMVISYDYRTFEDVDELTDEDYRIYGIMANKKGVCQAYAEAFLYMMQKLGINAKLVTGYANGGRHAWNCVELDGQWYQLDITWDDPVVTWTDYYIQHDYFLVSDRMLSADHSWESADYPQSPANYSGLSQLLFSYERGIRYSFDKSILYDYPSTLKDSYFAVPDMVYALVYSDDSRYMNSSLKEVYIPAGVEYISDRTFINCTNLKTIYGVRGTAAEAFALASGYTFVEYLPPLKAGDTDGNGRISAADAMLVLQYSCEIISLDDTQLSAADMDGNGEVTVYDAYLILAAAAA